MGVREVALKLLDAAILAGVLNLGNASLANATQKCNLSTTGKEGANLLLGSHEFSMCTLPLAKKANPPWQKSI